MGRRPLLDTNSRSEKITPLSWIELIKSFEHYGKNKFT